MSTLRAQCSAALLDANAQLGLQSASCDWHATWHDEGISPRLNTVLLARQALRVEAAEAEACGAELVGDIEHAIQNGEEQVGSLMALQRPVAKLTRRYEGEELSTARERCHHALKGLLATIESFVKQAAQEGGGGYTPNLPRKLRHRLSHSQRLIP